MILRLVKLLLFAVFLAFAAGEAYAQQQPSLELPDPPVPRRTPRPLNGADPQAAMMARMQSERNKKDHQEMLERGEEALRLANQLETAFEQNKGLTPQDKVRLASLENVVEKIRKELGGDDDEDVEELNYQKPVNEERPSTMEEGFKFLRSTTVKLVDELKKTTRFTISAIAIQSSNSVLKIVKFLRLRK